MTNKLNIVVVGASGDLSRKKIFPALFALFCQGYLPEKFHITGFSRSKFSNQQFRELLTQNLTCRYTPNNNTCQKQMQQFLQACSYIDGNYQSVDAFQKIANQTNPPETNTIFYLAIPANIVATVVKTIDDAKLNIHNQQTWTRFVVEKPFGYDRQSSDQLNSQLHQILDEQQIFRIDHYLGKEVVQNILVMRFANLIFEPVWNAKYIQKVDICWRENLPITGRAGYFDKSGIIRDIIQNHLTQILALITMEKPASQETSAIIQSKVQLLKAIPPVTIPNILLGQYTAANYQNKNYSSYTQEQGVPENSTTETFAKIKLQINNIRWQGVPITLIAGKAMQKSSTEVRILFKPVSKNIFCTPNGCPPVNQLLIRIQPDEGMHFSIINKVPGMKTQLFSKELDLSYSDAFPDDNIPDAYESLLLEVIQGEHRLFISDQELQASWDIFTPALHAIKEQNLKPKPYPFGTNGPEERYCCETNH